MEWILNLQKVHGNTKYNTEYTFLSEGENWAASCEKVPTGLSCCHTKRRTGMRGRARSSIGMTQTFPPPQKKKVKKKDFFFKNKNKKI